MSLTVNRLIRRKLRLSLILLVVYVAVDVAVALYPFSAATLEQLQAFGKLALAAALINAVVFAPHQSAPRRSRAGAVPDHPAGRDRHRA